MVEHALKDRSEKFAKSLPYSGQHFGNAFKFKSQAVQPVNDALAEAADSFFDLIPCADDIFPEFIVGFPERRKGGCQRTDHRHHGKHRPGNRTECAAKSGNGTAAPGNLHPQLGDAFRQTGKALHGCADCRSHFAEENEHGADGSDYRSDLYHGFLLLIVHAVQLVHKFLDFLRRRPDFRHEDFTEGNGQSFQRGLQNGDLTGQVIQLGIRHLLGRAAAFRNGLLETVPAIPGTHKQRVDGGQIGFIENGRDDVLLFSGSHPVHTGIQIPQNIVEGTHIAFGVVNLHAQALHAGGGFVRRALQGEDHVSQMRTAFRTLDAVVGKDAERGVQLRRAALDRLGGCADGQNGFTQLGNRGVGGGSRLGHLIHHGIGLAGFHAQSRHGVRHHVRCRCQINTTGRRKVQHGGQRIIDLLRIVTGQCQVVHGIRALAGGERRLGTHLLGKITEGFHRIDGLAV